MRALGPRAAHGGRELFSSLFGGSIIKGLAGGVGLGRPSGGAKG